MPRVRISGAMPRDDNSQLYPSLTKRDDPVMFRIKSSAGVTVTTTLPAGVYMMSAGVEVFLSFSRTNTACASTTTFDIHLPQYGGPIIVDVDEPFNYLSTFGGSTSGRLSMLKLGGHI